MTTKEMMDANCRVLVSSHWWGYGRNVSRIYFRAQNSGVSLGHKTENKNDASFCWGARQPWKYFSPGAVLQRKRTAVKQNCENHFAFRLSRVQIRVE
jgi:hypothetical protein